MAQTQRDYEVGYGKPPVGRRFQKGQSGNPLGARVRGGKKSLPALLLAALDEPAALAGGVNGRRVTKREAIVAQLVDKSAAADLRATRMLIDILKEVELKAGAAPPAPAKLAPADKEVVALFVARLRRQIAAEAEAASFETTAPQFPQDELTV